MEKEKCKKTCVDGALDEDIGHYCFSSREELREYLCKFMDDDYAYNISEAVRKGKFYKKSIVHNDMKELYKEQFALLPKSMVDCFSEIMYLPSKFVAD